jgi:Mitochondrial carrier protein
VVSSIATTPIDVVKTRLATGVIPHGTPIIQALRDIAQREGLHGLYAGVQARLLYSAVFGGVGFSCYEACKKVVGR